MGASPEDVYSQQITRAAKRLPSALYTAMLRISQAPAANGHAVLVLEGSVAGPWVREVERSCSELLAQGRLLTLDLAEVSFVDHGGMALLKDLARRSIAVVNCPLFLAEQLRAWGTS